MFGDTGFAASARPETLPSLPFLEDLFRTAQAAGVHALLMGAGFGQRVEAFTTAAAVLARVPGIRALIATRTGMHHPAIAAMLASTVDNLSDGRVLLNVVTGGDSDDMAAYGDRLGHDDRYRRTSEWLGVFTRLCAGETVTSDQWQGAAVTLLSVSKELGMPGARIGIVAGDRATIDVLRQHNSLFCVMLPEAGQHAVLHALQEFRRLGDRHAVSRQVTSLVPEAAGGWRSLGWPSNAVHQPQGGYKFVVGVPPTVTRARQFSAVELLDYFIVSRAGVKLSTSRSFRPHDERYLRMILMAEAADLGRAFQAMRAAGVSYTMQLPDGLAAEYEAFANEHLAPGPVADML